jgi:GNAT superfamily N-acetyltransferase
VSDAAMPGMQASVEEAPRWWVRGAIHSDLPAVAGGLADLLRELGGVPPEVQALERAAADVLEDPALGCLLVAETGESDLIGVLAASWQHAIHVPGRYCILQDLWTAPSWRNRGLGAALIAELLERMRASGIERVEVGLPSRQFTGLEATEAFYAANGFTPLGPRMRQVLR